MQYSKLRCQFRDNCKLVLDRLPRKYGYRPHPESLQFQPYVTHGPSHETGCAARMKIGSLNIHGEVRRNSGACSPNSFHLMGRIEKPASIRWRLSQAL